MRYTGYEAIEKAEKLGLKLNKYNDPIEGAREGLTVDEAKEIAQEDPGLIWVEAEQYKNRVRFVESELLSIEISDLAGVWAEDSEKQSWLVSANNEIDWWLSANEEQVLKAAAEEVATLMRMRNDGQKDENDYDDDDGGYG